ncbi:hypothetical protein J6590_107143, partial [Homalodisca vitripennis]
SEIMLMWYTEVFLQNMNPHIASNTSRELETRSYFHSNCTVACNFSQTCADDDHPLYCTSRTSLIHLIQEPLVISI